MTSHRLTLGVVALVGIVVAVLIAVNAGWLGNAVLALLVLALLAGTTTAEWPYLTPGWKALKTAVTAQQAVLAYGAVEAWSVDSPVGPRSSLLALSFLALLVAGGARAYETREARHRRGNP